MKARCPVSEDHKTFVTTAHVCEDWVVDADGNFIDHVGTSQVTHKPSAENVWGCHTCGAEAIVTHGDVAPATIS